MKIENYVKRCKYKWVGGKVDLKTYERNIAVFNTRHAADNFKTFCGKELNEGWFIESSAGLSIEDITCKSCIQKLKITLKIPIFKKVEI